MAYPHLYFFYAGNSHACIPISSLFRPSIIGIKFSAITAALIGFSLNSAHIWQKLIRSALAAEKVNGKRRTALGLSYW